MTTKMEKKMIAGFYNLSGENVEMQKELDRLQSSLEAERQKAEKYGMKTMYQEGVIVNLISKIKGLRLENEKLRNAFLVAQTGNVWYGRWHYHGAKPDLEECEKAAEEALSALVGEVRPIFVPGDSEALEKVAFDFEHLARDGGMAELFIERHCGVLRRLAEVAKGWQE